MKEHGARIGSRLELRLEFLGIERLADGQADLDGIQAVNLRDLGPPRAEFPAALVKEQLPFREPRASYPRSDLSQ